ncbi:ABC transporter substrate-binding protein [Desulfothermobacter acidiphilus]|uniref:ABC transporter substrate-binding protein n=1 Tax=Desulfothermobacter acidiphilus TaxID=1938353 RepID=UPI003F8A5606
MRKHGVIIGAILLLLVTVAFLGGCGQKPAPSQPAAVTITDSTGKTVEVPTPLNRVVVLDGDAAEAMRILKVQDVIVGVGDTVQQNPYLGLQDKPVVGKWNNPSMEKIVELKPQAVITYGKWPGPELEQKLEPTGIKVVRLDFYKPETYDSDLRALAKIFGKEKEAEEFIKWKQEKLALLNDRLKGLTDKDKPKVFAVWDNALRKGVWKTYGQGTATAQAIELGGGLNVARELKEYPQVSSEWILQQNPQVILIGVLQESGMGYKAENTAQAAAIQKEALGDPVLSKTEAAKQKRVYLLSTKLLGGDKSYLGAIFIAKWLYPERFQNVKPEQILKEYFGKWLGVPFKGIWAYPES